MTQTQLLILAGVIYIAPHVPGPIAIGLGCLFLMVASLIGLGWIA